MVESSVVRRNVYIDSVSLLQVSADVLGLPGVDAVYAIAHHEGVLDSGNPRLRVET